tara:strand:- start:458 stop:1300 length:843 start_codon:yes stop_codon:yes gene_type:complete
MSFFDKKQEVLDIKLTQFGKRLLSAGSFKPVYYCFFDDDIVYNSEALGFSEKQNRSQERIEESQRPRTQHNITAVEDAYDQMTDLIEAGEADVFEPLKITQNIELSDKMLSSPLYDTILSSQKAPRTKIKALGCNMTGSSDTLLSEGVVKQIPQLNFSASYTITRDDTMERDIQFFGVDSEYYIDLTSDEIPFLNGSKIITEKEDIIIDIVEENSVKTIGEFEIEFFEVIAEGEKTQLRKMDTEQEVYKYFDILVDGQIDQRIKESSEGRRSIPEWRIIQ